LDRSKHVDACGALKGLRRWTKDRHIASVLKLIVMVLLEAKWEEIQTGENGYNPHDDYRRSFYYCLQRSPIDDPIPPSMTQILRRPDCAYLESLPSTSEILRPTFPDVQSLQSNLPLWPPSDLEDWTKNRRFILSLFEERSPNLLPPSWTFHNILDLASKIESNGFGCFTGDLESADIYEDGVRLRSKVSKNPSMRRRRDVESRSVSLEVCLES
jgi:hypothetical protein